MRRCVIVACALLLGACEGSSEETDGGIILLNGDAGLGGEDAGTQSQTGALAVSAALGVVLTDLLALGEEKAVAGEIMVTRGSTGIEDAIVTFNGTTIPHWTGGLYSLEDVELAPVAPGSTLVIVARTTDPEETTTLTVECPGPVTITSPAAHTVVSDGQTIGVQWSGALTAEGRNAPYLGVRGCFIDDTQVTRWSLDGLELELGQSSAQIAIDEDCAHHLLELRYVGEEVRDFHDGALNMGSCYVQHRIWLEGDSK